MFTLLHVENFKQSRAEVVQATHTHTHTSVWTEKKATETLNCTPFPSSGGGVAPAVFRYLQHRGPSVCIPAAHRCRKVGGRGWPRQPPGSGSFLRGPLIPDLATVATPIQCCDNGQSQGETSTGLIGRQWLHSLPPAPFHWPLSGERRSHTLPNCHLASDRLRQARARPTMAVLTSVNAITKATMFLSFPLSQRTVASYVRPGETFRWTVMDLPGKGCYLMTGLGL